MKTIHTIGAYGGIAIGNAFIFQHQAAIARRQKIEDTKAELFRLSVAKKRANAQLLRLYTKTLSDIGKTCAQIFKIHMMMLEDEDFNEYIENIINAQSVNAEYAVTTASDNFSKMFLSMDSAYMQSRAADIKDISNRLISCLASEINRKPAIYGKAIICAEDLTPSEIISLDKARVLAIVTAFGSLNSHTSILARNMNIPACINAGGDFLKTISEGDEIIVDGHTGDIIIAPNGETKAFYRKKQAEDMRKKVLLQAQKGKENITKDGKKIDIFANIDSLSEISSALSNDAGGIGLFRSEFLYLESADFPTEDAQFCAYKKALKIMSGKRVIIRTLDMGTDKQADYFGLEREANPALGYRGIRISLTRPEIFKTQLRALYRASVYGNLGLLFPMITGVCELERIKSILEEVKTELKKDGFSYSENVEIGIMIETPAAALLSDELAPMVDFFSVGTNDLMQYTIACDRQNAKLEQFIDTHHKAVLKLIEMSAKNAHKEGVRIGICGELAGDISLTETFIKMGIDMLSVPAPLILPLRKTVRNIDLSR